MEREGRGVEKRGKERGVRRGRSGSKYEGLGVGCDDDSVTVPMTGQCHRDEGRRCVLFYELQ